VSANDDGDWDAMIARAKLRASSPQPDDDGDWDAMIARAKRMRASSPQDLKTPPPILERRAPTPAPNVPPPLPVAGGARSTRRRLPVGH
jgi:hypothetical protein